MRNRSFKKKGICLHSLHPQEELSIPAGERCAGGNLREFLKKEWSLEYKRRGLLLQFGALRNGKGVGILILCSGRAHRRRAVQSASRVERKQSRRDTRYTD